MVYLAFMFKLRGSSEILLSRRPSDRDGSAILDQYAPEGCVVASNVSGRYDYVSLHVGFVCFCRPRDTLVTAVVIGQCAPHHESVSL